MKTAHNQGKPAKGIGELMDMMSNPPHGMTANDVLRRDSALASQKAERQMLKTLFAIVVIGGILSVYVKTAIHFGWITDTTPKSSLHMK